MNFEKLDLQSYDCAATMDSRLIRAEKFSAVIDRLLFELELIF